MRGPTCIRLALLAAILALAGCGSSFDLPTESTNRAIPPDGSYQMIATWPGMTGVGDLLLTQGTGSQLFLLFNTGGSGTAPRGSVVEYSRTLGSPIGPPFAGLFNPVALCAGGDGAANRLNRVFVLDQGDTCLARRNPVSGTCDTTGRFGLRITQIQYYWYVREFDLLGNPIGAFTDTSLAFVNGIAGDAQGGVYVSGLAIILKPTDDPRLTDRTFEFRVYRYLRGPRSNGTPDPNISGASWHRDPDYEAPQGPGIGGVIDPRGLHWSAVTGPSLFVADLGNFRAEKISDGTVDLGGAYYYDTRDPGFDGGPAFTEPLDVTADLQGFFYVADASGSVHRFSNEPRAYVQRVDVERDAFGDPLGRPVAVAADGDFVYVADQDRGRVIRYRRRA